MKYVHTALATAGNLAHACVFPNKMTSWMKFSFPFRDLNLLKLWLVALKMDPNTEVGALKRADYRVCSAHFAPEEVHLGPCRSVLNSHLAHSLMAFRVILKD